MNVPIMNGKHGNLMGNIISSGQTQIFLKLGKGKTRIPSKEGEVKLYLFVDDMIFLEMVKGSMKK